MSQCGTVRAVLSVLSSIQGDGQTMSIEPIMRELSKLLESAPNAEPDRAVVILFANQVNAQQLNIECPGVQYGRAVTEDNGLPE